jgi:hypothetical protein
LYWGLTFAPVFIKYCGHLFKYLKYTFFFTGYLDNFVTSFTVYFLSFA